MVEIPIIFAKTKDGSRNDLESSSVRSERIRVLNSDKDNFRVLITELSSLESSDNETMVIRPQKENSQPAELLFLNQKYEISNHGKATKNFRTQDIRIRIDYDKLTIRAQCSATKNKDSSRDCIEKSIPLAVPLSKSHIKATHMTDERLLIVAQVAKAIHKEIPIVSRSGIDMGKYWIDSNSTEDVDVIQVVNKEMKCFLLLRLTLEPPFAVSSTVACVGIRLWCAAGNRLCISGEANWPPTSRTMDSPFEEHRSFRRVFVAPGLIDVSYAKAEVFEGKYLIFEAPLIQ
nr:heat shock protein20 related protein [Hymenolepis microstoma]